MNGPRRLLVRTLTALLLVGAGPTFSAQPSGPAPVAPAAQVAPASKQAQVAPASKQAKNAASKPTADAAALNTDDSARNEGASAEEAAIAALTEPAPTEPALNDEPLGAAAATEPNDPFAEELALAGSEDESLIWTLVRTFLVLGVVIACIYVVLNFGLRRMMGLKPGGQGTHALVTVVDRIPLDPKHTLLVLKAAGEYLLVGSGDAGMNLIAKLQTEEVERLQRDRTEAAGAMSPFLQKLLSRGGHPPPSA